MVGLVDCLIDEKGVTKTIQDGANLVTHKIIELGQDLHLPEAFSALGQKIDELDKSLGIADTYRVTSDLLTQKSHELEITVKAAFETVILNSIQFNSIILNFDFLF